MALHAAKGSLLRVFTRHPDQPGHECEPENHGDEDHHEHPTQEFRGPILRKKSAKTLSRLASFEQERRLVMVTIERCAIFDTADIKGVPRAGVDGYTAPSWRQADYAESFVVHILVVPSCGSVALTFVYKAWTG
jgi:hypothetical protein